ncbi:unnamed protein product [Closterium sp. NIES-53]
MAGLMGFAAGTLATPSENYLDLHAEFRVVQLLTFTVISRCCSPDVQIALKPCRDYLVAGHHAWHFIESTYQNVRHALLHGVVRHPCPEGAPEQLQPDMRLSVVPSIRATLNEDSQTSYILRDKAMQEAEQSLELLPQANYIAPAKQGGRPRQRGQSGGGGSSGGRLAKYADKKKSAKDSGEFLGKDFTAFVNGKGIVHDLTCPYTLQQNGMAEREMRTMVESVHMGVQHPWWHLTLRQAVWVCKCLERSALPLRTTTYQLLTGKKPDLSLARMWGYMAQFLVPEQQRGGKLKPKARGARRTQVNPPTDTSTVTLPLLAEIDGLAYEDAEDVRPRSPAPAPPLVADLRGLTLVSASGDEGRSEALPVAPANSIAGGRRDAVKVGVGVNLTPTREQQAKEVQPTLVKPAKEAPAMQQLTGELAAANPTKEQPATGQSAGKPTAGEKSAGTSTVV